MAVILDAFVKACIDKLVKLATERVVMMLGVEEELRQLQGKLNAVKDFLADAESKRIKDQAIQGWVAELKDVMYDIDDIIDRCRIEGGQLLEAGSSSSSSSGSFICCRSPLLSCFGSPTSLPLRYQMGTEIKRLNDRLEGINKNRSTLNLAQINPPAQERGGSQRDTTSLLKSNIVGIEIEKATQTLVEAMIKEDGQNVRVFAIIGTGGIGKTTLAQKIYNNKKLMAQFEPLIWVCVSQSFSQTELLKEIMRSAGGDNGQAQTKQELSNILKSTISKKKYFLVLDDVWQAKPNEPDVWKDVLQAPLEQDGSRGTILVTTRDENVAMEMGAVDVHRVKKLSTDEGWLLLCKNVFRSKEEEEVHHLWDVGKQIVEKCDGLPLAITTIAGVLRKKAKTKIAWETVHKNSAWSSSELPEELQGPRAALYLSYGDLPSPLKQCFLYCSLFPEDFQFDKYELSQQWVAEGFVRAQGNVLMEEIAEDYYDELVSRSILEPHPDCFSSSVCTMHDLMRSLAQFLAQDEGYYGDVGGLSSIMPLKLRRLSISNAEEKWDVVLDALTVPKCLRTLMATPRIMDDLFGRLSCLRVLVLRKAKLETVPESIGDLIHLRLLDLKGSMIRALPESIGRLTNLQFLNLNNCECLQALPEGITGLCNLRSLVLDLTPLSHLPRGIGKLQQLTELCGFRVGNQQQRGSSLEDLKSFSQLRFLVIKNLERAHPGGSLVLEDKTHLKILFLASELDRSSNIQLDIGSIRQVYEELSPPPCLEKLRLINFLGTEHPSWMQASYLRTSLSNLTSLHLVHCVSLQQLPPLGELPQLSYLRIVGASAVVTIGLEFLSSSLRREQAAFPNLEYLELDEMPNWREWILPYEVEGSVVGGTRTAPVAMPCLTRLVLKKCPQLTTLPQGLRQLSILQRVHIRGAHSLRDVGNLPFLSEYLEVMKCKQLERVSGLFALRCLCIVNCYAIKNLENLDALQELSLVDDSMEQLPEWLLGFLHQKQREMRTEDGFQKLWVKCRSKLVERCFKGGPYWSLLHHVPKVDVLSLDGAYLDYNKTPFKYHANAASSD